VGGGARKMRAMTRWLCACLLTCLLGACTGYRPPPGYGACASQPGSWDCQIEQYEKVDSP